MAAAEQSIGSVQAARPVLDGEIEVEQLADL
jgi:hypothetical protein